MRRTRAVSDTERRTRCIERDVDGHHPRAVDGYLRVGCDKVPMLKERIDAHVARREKIVDFAVLAAEVRLTTMRTLHVGVACHGRGGLLRPARRRRLCPYASVAQHAH